MDRDFYFFRHGETDWNKANRCQGHTDVPLNQTGVLQAVDLSKKIKNINLEIIFSSDLIRAKETALIVSNQNSIDLNFSSNFREMNYGKAEGMLYEEAKNTFGEDLWFNIHNYKVDFDHIGFPDGEKRIEARNRFLLELNQIIKSTSYKNIGISTHGGIMRNVIHSFLPEDAPLLPIPNCVVYNVKYFSKSNQFKLY